MAEVTNKQFTPYQAKPDEEFMNKTQLNHFRKILNDWKAELSQELDRTVHTMQDEVTTFADPNDRASQESDITLELRNRCLLYTSPSPRDRTRSRMPSSA